MKKTSIKLGINDACLLLLGDGTLQMHLPDKQDDEIMPTNAIELAILASLWAKQHDEPFKAIWESLNRAWFSALPSEQDVPDKQSA